MTVAKSFGPVVRRKREEMGISLREMAKRIKVTPTYLSKVEREEISPPAEDRIKALARELGLQEDKLLAIASKVSTDLQEIIRRRPEQYAVLLRSTRGYSAKELEDLTRRAKEKKR